MECTIKIIAGPEAGQEFVCGGGGTGQTVLGRSPRCAVKLSAGSVSYEHAMIVWEDSTYFVENLSANGTFLNNERVTGRTRLRVKDQIRLGAETVVRVEKLPAAAGGGGSRTWLLVAVVVMLVVLAAVVVIDPLADSAGAKDWSKIYAALQPFAQEEAGGGKLPAEVPGLLREAWRLESAGDRANAAKAWLRLHVLLNDTEGKTGIGALAARRPGALGKVVKGAGEPALSTEDMRAALLEFVMQMERRK